MPGKLSKKLLGMKKECIIFTFVFVFVLYNIMAYYNTRPALLL